MGVVDDEEQHVVTAGAIITVTVILTRKTMDTLISGSGVAISAFEDNDEGYHAEDKELDVIDTDEINEISDLKQKLEDQYGNDDENEDGKKTRQKCRKTKTKAETKT